MFWVGPKTRNRNRNENLKPGTLFFGTKNTKLRNRNLSDKGDSLNTKNRNGTKKKTKTRNSFN